MLDTEKEISVLPAVFVAVTIKLKTDSTATMPERTQVVELKLTPAGGAGVIEQMSVPTSNDSSWLGVTEKAVATLTEYVGA